jgi:hypothetical protein
VNCERHYIGLYGSVRDRFEFKQRLDALIGRVEAWSYAESDAGAGLPVELAAELKALASRAPSPALKLGVRRAQDALDDGLSAEAVAAALYAVRAELDAGGGQLPAPPSPSG